MVAPKRNVASIVRELRSALESRVFCAPAAPAAESRSLSVERRSFAVEAEPEGEPLLRIESRCECEAGGEETKREYIVGYAAKFGVNSLNLGKFTERISPSAFSLVTERRGRKKTLDTRALFNHNADLPLAKYPGTLKLSVDDVGLRYEFPVPDTSYGRDLAANIRDGIVTGSSFSFTVPKDGEEWSMEEGRSIRTVTRVDSLIDVGPVTYPAYPDTDAAVAQRSYEMFIKKSESRIFCATGAGGGKDSSCSPKDAGGGGGSTTASDSEMKSGAMAASKAIMSSGMTGPGSGKGNVTKYQSPDKSQTFYITEFTPKGVSDGSSKKDAWRAASSALKKSGWKIKEGAAEKGADLSKTSDGKKPDTAIATKSAKDGSKVTVTINKSAWDESGMFEAHVAPPAGKAPITQKAEPKFDYSQFKDKGPSFYKKGGSKKPGKGKRSLFANRGQAVKKAKLLRRSITRLAAAEIRAVLKKHGS